MKKYLHKINIIMTIQFDNFVSWHKKSPTIFYEHSFTDRDFFSISHFHRMYRGSPRKKLFLVFNFICTKCVKCAHQRIYETNWNDTDHHHQKKFYVHIFYCIFNDINFNCWIFIIFCSILPLYWIMWLQLLFCFLAHFFRAKMMCGFYWGCGAFDSFVCLLVGFT